MCVIDFSCNWRQKELIPANESTISIELLNVNKKLFLRAKIWGVAGNHEQIVLSHSDSSLPNKKTDYLFYTSKIFYKVVNEKNISIYAPGSSISEPANKLPYVTLKVLKTADEVRDYNTNYEKYGLKRFSIYD